MKFVVKVFLKTTIKTFKVTSIGYGIWTLGHMMGEDKSNREWGSFYIKQLNERRDKENQ